MPNNDLQNLVKKTHQNIILSYIWQMFFLQNLCMNKIFAVI